MNLYCIRCSKFTKNKNITIKHKIDGKFFFFFSCIPCGFEKPETIDKVELSGLLKG